MGKAIEHLIALADASAGDSAGEATDSYPSTTTTNMSMSKSSMRGKLVAMKPDRSGMHTKESAPKKPTHRVIVHKVNPSGVHSLTLQNTKSQAVSVVHLPPSAKAGVYGQGN